MYGERGRDSYRPEFMISVYLCKILGKCSLTYPSRMLQDEIKGYAPRLPLRSIREHDPHSPDNEPQETWEEGVSRENQQTHCEEWVSTRDGQ